MSQVSNTEENKPKRNPDPLMPWKDLGDPNVVLLDGDDPTAEGWKMRRDTSKDPKREPGLFNPNRYEFGLQSIGGFPTFLGAPLAMTPDDLKAGNVDVAVVGATAESHLIPGGRFAANAIRAMPDWMQSKHGKGAGMDQWTRVNYMDELVIADYGNVAYNYHFQQRGVEELATVLGEILDAGVLPMAVGGTHINAYAHILALAKKYGPGEVMMIHFDGHHDAYNSLYGIYIHSGSFIRVGVEKGLLKGEDIVNVGLRGPSPDEADLEWMRKHKLKSHFMAEIEHRGWETVMNNILDEVKGRKIYISFDVDVLDPAYAPAVGTQSINGLTTGQAQQILRALTIQNEVVSLEFIEYSPLLDDVHKTTGVTVDRLMRTTLAGITARKQGITDPFFIHPDVLDHA